MLFVRSRFLGFRVIVLAVAAIILIYAEHHGRLGRVRSSLSYITAPLQYMVNWPVTVIHWVDASFTTQRTLRIENAQLHTQALLAEAKLQRLETLQEENQQLRALLGSSSHVGGKVLVAQLLAVDLAPFTQQVILDKGVHHGVYLGQPVLDDAGVMGQVISVGPMTSRVILISDSRSAVPTQNQRTGSRAIAAGTGMPNRLHLLYVPDTADYEVGDTLVTSGLGQRYPVGYPVGVITKVDHKVGERFTTVYLTPAAHLNSSRQVLLAWPDQLLNHFTKENVIVRHFNSLAPKKDT